MNKIEERKRNNGSVPHPMPPKKKRHAPPISKFIREIHAKNRKFPLPLKTRCTCVANQLAAAIYGKPNLTSCLGISQGNVRVADSKAFATHVYLPTQPSPGETIDRQQGREIAGIQKSIRNIVKHAGSRGITIQLHSET
jgi:hypothetical protein